MLARRRQQLLDTHVVGYSDHFGPRDHHLADHAVREFHGAPDDQPFAFLQHALLRRDGDQHLELLFAVHVELVSGTDADPTQDRVRASVHEGDERIHEPVEEVERIGAPERERDRALDRKILRRQLADHDMDVRDHSERQRERDHVQERVGQPVEDRFEQRGDGRLAKPSDRQRAERHAELGCRDVLVEPVQDPRREPRASASLLADLVELCLADTHESFPNRTEPYRFARARATMSTIRLYSLVDIPSPGNSILKSSPRNG